MEESTTLQLAPVRNVSVIPAIEKAIWLINVKVCKKTSKNRTEQTSAVTEGEVHTGDELLDEVQEYTLYQIQVGPTKL